MCRNELNPVFATPVSLNYFFEQVQELRFLVVDVDNAKKMQNLKAQDTIGECVRSSYSASTLFSILYSPLSCIGSTEFLALFPSKAGAYLAGFSLLVFERAGTLFYCVC